MNQYLLSLLIFIPLAGAILILLVPSRKRSLFKKINLGVSIIQLILGIILYAGYHLPSVADGYTFQFEEKAEWIRLDLGGLGKLAIDYHLGVDGISVGLVLLSIVVLLAGSISSWNINQKQKGYFALYLLLNASIVGCFVALDLFLFYLFFEFMLLPMYFLIGIWGGPRRMYASIKFFIYTLVGSILILIVIIGLYSSNYDPQRSSLPEKQSINSKTEIVHTFSMVHISEQENTIPGSVFSTENPGRIWGFSYRELAFLLLLVGFAIKVPAVPLHTWLPDAHVEAPTPVSVILAGILLKIGGYGIIRIAYPVFPEAARDLAIFVGVLGIISIIYGALNALAQKDLKRLIAYSSVSHMGFVLLGIAALTVESVTGAIYQMVSHGLITSMLFLIAGVVYDRTHDRMIENYSGLAKRMPHYAVIVACAFFAGLGLPGFSGFIAELFVLLGSYQSIFTPTWMTVAAVIGIILAAVYFLWTIQRMFFGNFFVRFSEYEDKLKDLNLREYIMFVPLIILTLILGIFPNTMLDLMNGTIDYFINNLIGVIP